jgi:hypothetical protein
LPKEPFLWQLSIQHEVDLMADKGNERAISFRVTTDVPQLNQMLEARGPTATDFFRPLTAAAVELHMRGDDPIAALNNWPANGLEFFEQRHKENADLLIHAQLALSEMRSGLSALWPTLVASGAATPLSIHTPIATEINASDVLRLGAELVEMARAVVHALDRVGGLTVPLERS